MPNVCNIWEPSGITLLKVIVWAIWPHIEESTEPVHLTISEPSLLDAHDTVLVLTGYDSCEALHETLDIELSTVNVLVAADGGFLAESYYFSEGCNPIFIEALSKDPDVDEYPFLIDGVADVLEEEELLKL